MRITLLTLALLVSTLIDGQDFPKRICPAQRTEVPPVINGALDDDAWTAGVWQGDFFQYEPDEGAPVKQKTEFKILYDDDNIYVALKAYDTAPDSIVSRMTRRDHGDGDQVYVYFDSYHDLRTAFGFGVSVAGVKSDVLIADDGSTEDGSWDPIWYVKTAIAQWGWIAEMKIPLTQLRFSAVDKQVWGLEIVRNTYRYDESDLWQPIARNASGLVHNAGLLEGINNIRPEKQLDITPYGVGKLETYESEQGNPWKDGSDIKANGGLDARIGITNNMTLSLTVNPDFGQVEADPSEVNLTAFETFFEEKRPFFIEGKNITDFNLGLGDDDEGNDNLFYSRRIGRSPKHPYSAGDDELTYTPHFTPILGAAKLTGKSGDGWSVGVLEAVTSGVKSRIYNSLTHQTSYVTAEPLANYSVGRVQKDINNSNTIVGGMITGTIRDLDDATADYFHKSAFTGGIDFTQYFGKKNYIFQLRTAFSNVSGNENAIARTQRSPVHNFMRPDADYVNYDNTRTSLSGTGGNLLAGKLGGNWQLLYLSSWKSPGFETNDIGYMQIADQYLGVVAASYNIYKPFSIFNQMNFSSNFVHLLDFGGTTTIVGQAFSWSAQFKNLWSAYAGTQVNSRQRDNRMLRGGPSIKMPGAVYIYGGFDSSERNKLVTELNFSFNKGMQDVYQAESVSLELSYRPTSTLELSIEPEWYHMLNNMQYVDTIIVSDAIPENTINYIFGKINQKVLSISFRVDFNITPDLTIQYWGQPFFGSGKYSDFKKITNTEAEKYEDRFHLFTPQEITKNTDGDYDVDEGSDGINDYSFGNPDFTVSEFLSNMVVRWEFMPGSTAFLVWSQTREYSTGDGIFNLNQQLSDVFSANKAYNVFLIKLSYRFGLH